MLGQLKLNDDWAADDSLSLNIEKRRARTKQWDLELLSLENIRRVGKDLEPYADVTIWKEESEVDEDNIAESDPMLQEAGHILIDQIGLAPRL